MSRQDGFIVSVTLDGTPLGLFLAMSDTEMAGEGDKVPQPGGGFVRYPGRAVPGEFTLERTFEVPRDSDRFAWYESRANKGDISATERVANGDGTPGAAVRTLGGRLTTVAVTGSDTRETGNRVLTLTVDRIT